VVHEHADKTRIAEWRETLDVLSAEEILAWAADAFPGQISLASSLGVEDQVLTQMIAARRLPIGIFTLDTGRLFPEAYDLIAETTRRYSVAIRVYVPAAEDVETMVSAHGVNLFRDGVAERKRCCEVRKLRPLRRALSGSRAWVCGLRREQSVTRAEVEAIEWDEANGLVKINPLHAWTEADVWAYVREHDVVYNPLHDRGFPSVGCAPCTRAIEPGEDVRAGRWWWESAEHRECGLHAHREGSRSADEPSSAEGGER